MGQTGRPKGISCPTLITKGIKKAGNQSNLARALGATRQSVSLWKFGLARPSERFYRKLVGFLKGRYWYRKAAAQNDAWGLLDVAFAYRNGTGVPKDDKEAMKYFQLTLKTANDDCRRRALHGIGFAYENGLGVKKDPVEAMRNYKVAAEQGFANSQHGMGYLNETVLKNSREAFRWYMMAAKQGLPEAQTNVGNCYWSGRGVKKDLDEAERWLVMAAQHGQPQGVKYLEQLRAEKASQPAKK